MGEAVEPAVALAAAWGTHHAVAGADSGFAQRCLGLSVAALAIAGGLHVLWLMLGLGPDPILVAAWMVVTPPTLGLQVYAVSDRTWSLTDEISLRGDLHYTDQRSVGDDLLTGADFDTHQVAASLAASFKGAILRVPASTTVA